MIEVVRLRACFGVNMRKAYLLVVILSISLVTILYTPSVLAKKLGQEGKVTFPYDTTAVYTASDPLIVYAVSEGENMSEVRIWKESGNLTIMVEVWSKLVLGYGEHELDKNPKDGVMDDTTFPYDYGKEEIGSDGVKIIIAGTATYEWKTNGVKHTYLDCPNYDDNDGAAPYTDWGIWQTPIVYTADIPILSGWTDEFEIYMEVHASPPLEFEFWIPEFPFGTISAVVAFFAALGVIVILRK